MKKVGILTHYEVLNQGAQLQMYATYNFLKDNGYDSYVLTFQKDFSFEKEEKLKNDVSFKSIPYLLKHYLFEKGLRLTIHNVKKFYASKKFRKKNFLFKPFDTNDIDVAIMGSDEVFSLDVGINKMMFTHGVKAKKTIAYAPSFGKTDLDIINSFNCYDVIKDGLNNFSYLSARDIHTKQVIKEIIDKDVPMVCDPVILYQFKKNESFKAPKYKYIVLYSYDRHFVDKEEIDAVKSFAKSVNMKVISVGTYHKWCDKNIVCNALDWVEWIRNAEFVITDTFHGSVVSIITKVPMAVYIRKAINSNKLSDLLSKFELQDRQLKNIDFEEIKDIYSNELDKEKLELNIEKAREVGKNYLLNALND